MNTATPKLGLASASPGFLFHLSEIALAAHERQLALIDLVEVHRGDGRHRVDFAAGEYISGSLRCKCGVLGVLTAERWE